MIKGAWQSRGSRDSPWKNKQGLLGLEGLAGPGGECLGKGVGRARRPQGACPTLTFLYFACSP